jgi:preprotein translocase subunit SecF
MTARTIIGLLGLVVLLGITVYLLFQIPWEYGVGGIVALAGLLVIVGTNEPGAL